MRLKLYILSVFTFISLNTWADTNTPFQAVESFYKTLYVDKDSALWLEVHSEKRKAVLEKAIKPKIFKLMSNEIKDYTVSLTRKEVEGNQAHVEINLVGKIARGDGDSQYWKDYEKRKFFELVKENDNWKVVGFLKSHKWGKWK